MLSNRHVVVAFLLLPLLSLLGWWAAGTLTGEQPGAAQQGMSYPLVARSGCRYAGGACTMENVDVRLALAQVEDGIELQASLPLEGVLLAIGSPGDQRSPLAMTRRDERGTQWRLLLSARPEPGDRIRLAARARGITWFGETGTAFLHARTPGSE
jgi:hypothetical protein